MPLNDFMEIFADMSFLLHKAHLVFSELLVTKDLWEHICYQKAYNCEP